ncbi:hypothetical protein DB30_02027 [Enhygromyxa salina]|uniref:Arrestin-like N-terminal domain-containing protein n=1 Tax=Enhygromyxa salina TaxID=215803 RepID=A0A0C2CW74_9BACT|nr:hypothetical protein [Enhygromyxa salina]KIG12112.1 hypothetical protein DB30_02027 [Enhygromyxa salina]
MALIKTRPNVRLLLPRRLVAGQVGEFIVELHCPEPVPVDAVALTLFGDVAWYANGQYGRHRHSSRFLNHQIPLLCDQTVLEAGQHRLQTAVSLSAELPGSREGDRLNVEYSVHVHVDIPWWPDKRVDFVVRLAAAAAAARSIADQGAMVFVSHAGGPPPKGPYLEVSLGQRCVVAGGMLRLSAALGNVDRNRYRKLHVDVIAQERFPEGLGHATNDQIVNRWAIALDAHPGELQPILFNLQLPSSLVPGFELHGCKLRWLLDVHADVAWGSNPQLRVPIHVEVEAADEARSGQPEIAAPLAVGSARLRLIWSNVAQATGLELIDDRLRGVVDGVAIELRRGYDHDGRPRILGLLEFPDLGVGLHTRRERRTLLGSIETTLATRDAAQTKVIHAQLGARTLRADYELIAADDLQLRFALDGAGLEIAPLRDFAAWLVELAPTVAGLPDEMPVPAVMVEHAASWERSAKRSGARLRRSDLRLELIRDELRVVIGSDFNDEGELRATRLELDAPATVPSRHHLIWTGDTALPEHELPIAELVRPPQWGIAPARVALHIEAQRVRVLLPTPLSDPDLERDRVEALFALGRHLRGDQGPYR